MAVPLDRLMETWDPVLQQAFVESILNLRDAAQLEMLIKALEDNDIEAAIRAIGLNPVAFRPFDRALSNMFEVAGTETAKGLPVVRLDDGFKVNFQFNIRNPAAEQWLRDNSSTLVKEVLDDQRTLIQNHLRVSLQNGDNPRTAALDLVGRVGASGRRENGIIGLTSSQAEWVRNYEAALRSDNPADALNYNLRDARFDRTVEKGDLTDSQINAMVDAYTNRALRYRAETIALNETVGALHEAQAQAVQQALDTGALERKHLTKIWHTAHDDRVRESHKAMDGQEVSIDEKFVSGAGNFLDRPHDPAAPPEEIIGCRCWMETRVDFLQGVN